MSIDLVSTTRLIEDSTAAVLMLTAIVLLFKVGMASPKHRFVTLSLGIGLVPLWIWKTMGAVRRAFIDKMSNADLYTVLHDTGEIFETFSGLTLAVAIVLVSVWTLGE